MELWWISVVRIIYMCVSVCVRALIYIYIMCVMMSVLGDQVVSAVTHVTNSQNTELES